MTLEKEKGKSFIEHFGVKGMRWGVTRSKSAIAKDSGKKEGGDKNAPAKPKPPVKKATSKTNSRLQKKAVQDMSDAELKSYVNRLNMEQQYAKMQPVPLSKKTAKFVTDIAMGALKQQLTNQLSTEIGKQIGAARTSASNRKNPPKPRLVEPPKGPRLG